MSLKDKNATIEASGNGFGGESSEIILGEFTEVAEKRGIAADHAAELDSESSACDVGQLNACASSDENAAPLEEAKGDIRWRQRTQRSCSAAGGNDAGHGGP